MTVRERVYGFEGGAPRQWSGGGGGAITGITCTVGAARTGNYGLRIAPSASIVNIQGFQNAPVAAGYFVCRPCIRFESALPTGDCSLMSWFTGTTRYRLLFRSSDGILRMEHDTAGVQNEVQNGPVVVADTFYRLDCMFVGNAASATGEGTPKRRMQWSVDGIAQPTVGPVDTYLAAITFWTLGNHANATFVMHVDDIVSIDNTDGSGDSDETKALYPWGESGVVGLKTVGVGTHNNSSVFATSAGAIADSWQLLDQDPMTGLVDYILQNTIDTAAYLEYTHADIAADVSPRAVGVHTGTYSTSGSQSSVINIHSIDGANDYASIPGSVAGTTVQMQNAGVPGRPWTQARVNALLSRVGYSSDVTPNPRAASVLFEVDVETITGPEAGWGVLLS